MDEWRNVRSRNENYLIFTKERSFSFHGWTKEKKRKKNKRDKNEVWVDNKIGRFPFGRRDIVSCKYSCGRNQVNRKTIWCNYRVRVERHTDTGTEFWYIISDISKYRQCTDFCHFFSLSLVWLNIILLLFIWQCHLCLSRRIQSLEFQFQPCNFLYDCYLCLETKPILFL